MTVIFAAIMAVLSLWLLGACGAGSMKNVSERRSGYFAAADETLTVTAVSGVRELPYVIDGVAGELKPYTLITIVPSKFDVDAVYTFSATTEDGAFGGTFIAHPFAASFSAEFDCETKSDFTVAITVGGHTTEYALKSQVSADAFSYDKAIDAARNELEPAEPYELRVRMIKNPLGDGLCWHVAFYTAGGTASGVLLDPVTAKVIAKKN